MKEVNDNSAALAQSVISEVKARLYDLKEFTVGKVESDPNFYGSSRYSVSITLPNGDSVRVSLVTDNKKAGV